MRRKQRQIYSHDGSQVDIAIPNAMKLSSKIFTLRNLSRPNPEPALRFSAFRSYSDEISTDLLHLPRLGCLLV